MCVIIEKKIGSDANMFAVRFVGVNNTRFDVRSRRCNIREKLKSGGLFFPLDDGLVIDRIRVINVTTDRRRKLFSKLDTYLALPNRPERSNSSVIRMIRYGCTNNYRASESEMEKKKQFSLG